MPRDGRKLKKTAQAIRNRQDQAKYVERYGEAAKEAARARAAISRARKRLGKAMLAIQAAQSAKEGEKTA